MTAPNSAPDWFFKVGDQVCGPVSPIELRQQAVAGEIGPDTPIREGADGRWLRAGMIQGLCPMPSARPSVIPPPPPPSARNLQWPMALVISATILGAAMVVCSWIKSQEPKYRALDSRIVEVYPNGKYRPLVRTYEPPRSSSWIVWMIGGGVIVAIVLWTVWPRIQNSPAKWRKEQDEGATHTDAVEEVGWPTRKLRILAGAGGVLGVVGGVLAGCAAGQNLEFARGVEAPLSLMLFLTSLVWFLTSAFILLSVVCAALRRTWIMVACLTAILLESLGWACCYGWDLSRCVAGSANLLSEASIVLGYFVCSLVLVASALNASGRFAKPGGGRN